MMWACPQVFTTLALVGMLIVPLNSFPWVLNSILEAKVSLERIQRFFRLTNRDLQAYYAQGRPVFFTLLLLWLLCVRTRVSAGLPGPPAEGQPCILLDQASFSWQRPGQDEGGAAGGSLLLHTLNLRIAKVPAGF